MYHNLEVDFQAFFYNSPVPMGLLNRDMRFVTVNKEVLRQLDYTEEELIGKSVSDFTAVGDIGYDIENLTKLLNRQINSYSLERAYLRKDGTLIKGANTVSLLEFNGETYVLAIFHNRMKKEERLGYVSESNNTLSKILSINPDIHYIMDIENKEYIYQNIDILNYFGYTEEDLEGNNRIEFLIKKIDASSIMEVAQANVEFKERISIGEFVEVEYRFESKHEGWKWLRAKSTPLVHIAPGKVKLSYGIIQDITHQKEIEEKLLAQEAFINQIANLVPDVVAVYDIDTYAVLYSNVQRRTFLGFTQKEWTEDKIVQALPEYKHHLKNQNEALLKLSDNQVYSEEVQYYNKAGEPTWIVVKSKVFKRNEEGKPTQILLIASDIHDYKSALESLAKAKRTNTAILDAIPDLLLVVNKDGIYTNAMSGVELRIENDEDVIGKTIHDVLNPDTADVTLDLVKSCLKTGEVKYHEFKHVYTDGRPDAYFSNYFSKLNAEEVLIIARDETEKKLAENSLDDQLALLSVQNEQLEKFITKNSELERFAYIIAHDLKEPLRSISAISELIQMEVDAKSNKVLSELLTHLSNNASRMTSLIEGVLAYSKIDSENVRMKLNLDKLVRNILFDLNSTIVSRNVNIQLGELGTISGNETQIRQLFQNLISNALKFNMSEEPLVIINKKEEDGQTVFYVEDNGIGIEPKFRSSIFMMFKRVNNYDQYPGQGIGLSMCKRIVESHQGQIWIEDPKNQGSRFCFTLREN